MEPIRIVKKKSSMKWRREKKMKMFNEFDVEFIATKKCRN